MQSSLSALWSSSQSDTEGHRERRDFTAANSTEEDNKTGINRRRKSISSFVSLSLCVIDRLDKEDKQQQEVKQKKKEEEEEEVLKVRVFISPLAPSARGASQPTVSLRQCSARECARAEWMCVCTGVCVFNHQQLETRLSGGSGVNLGF